jgi:CheY-like chemotaxis protein
MHILPYPHLHAQSNQPVCPHRGFRVIGFTEPHLALDHFLKNSYLYWLIVSDIRMPLMDGYQFQVKEIKHDVKVFFMSAYLIDDIQFRTFVSQGHRPNL